MRPDAMILGFFIYIVLSQLFHLTFFSLIKRLFSSSLLSAISMVSFTYLKLLMFLPPTLIPACNPSSPAFLMIYSVYISNKQGDSRQPWRPPLSFLKQSVVPNRVLTVASWSTYKFLRGQVKWCDSHLFKSFAQFLMIHTVKGFSVINETEVVVFLEFLCFLYDPSNVDCLFWTQLGHLEVLGSHNAKD